MGGAKSKKSNSPQVVAVAHKRKRTQFEKVQELKDILKLQDDVPIFNSNNVPRLKSKGLKKLCNQLNDEVGKASILLKVRQMECKGRLDVIEEKANRLLDVQNFQQKNWIKFEQEAQKTIMPLTKKLDFVENSIIEIISNLESLANLLPPERAPPPVIFSPNHKSIVPLPEDEESMKMQDALHNLGFISSPAFAPTKPNNGNLSQKIKSSNVIRSSEDGFRLSSPVYKSPQKREARTMRNYTNDSNNDCSPNSQSSSETTNFTPQFLSGSPNTKRRLRSRFPSGRKLAVDETIVPKNIKDNPSNVDNKRNESHMENPSPSEILNILDNDLNMQDKKS